MTDGRYADCGNVCENVSPAFECRSLAGTNTFIHEVDMFKGCFSAILLAVVSMQSMAADDAEKIVREAFKKISPNGKVTEVKKSEVPGFYQVLVDANVYFISADGKYLIRGNVFDIDSRQDIGDKQLSAMRKTALAKITKDKELVFAPDNPKYTVTVFTDVDCPYCRQFHKQIAEYNKLGIAVKYVFYPLPMHPGADKKAETVWCAADRNSAYTTAMNGSWDAPKAQVETGKQLNQAIADAVKAPPKPADTAPATKPEDAYKPQTCANPIAELTELGKSMGVDGTPAIFGPQGEHLGGYLPPEQLAQRLDQIAQRAQPAAAK
jgi:thiol:disulfide interchange protein DsbC